MLFRDFTACKASLRASLAMHPSNFIVALDMSDNNEEP